MKEKRFIGVKVDPDLHDECKIVAIRQGISFETLAGYALQYWLELDEDMKTSVMSKNEDIEIV